MEKLVTSINKKGNADDEFSCVGPSYGEHVRQTRMTFDIGYSRDIQQMNTKEKRTIERKRRLVSH